MVMKYYKWRGRSGSRVTRGKVYEVDSKCRFYNDNGRMENRGNSGFDPTYWEEVDTPPGDGSVEVSWHPLPDPLPVPPFVPPPPASPSPPVPPVPPPVKTRYCKWPGSMAGFTKGKMYLSIGGGCYDDDGKRRTSHFPDHSWKEVDMNGEELSLLTKEEQLRKSNPFVTLKAKFGSVGAGAFGDADALSSIALAALAVNAKYNSNDHNPKGDTIMLDFNKKSGAFIRVYGVELTDKTDDQLMSMIREAREHIKSLEDLKDVSKKVASKIKEVEASIKTMVTKLDSGEE